MKVNRKIQGNTAMISRTEEVDSKKLNSIKFYWRSEEKLIMMKCENSHIFYSHVRNKLINISIWVIDMWIETLKCAPLQQLSNHI